MRIKLLCNPNDKGINGKNWKLNNYRFFRDELSKQVDLDISPLLIDYSQLDCDAVILWSLLPKNLHPWDKNLGLSSFKELDCLKITRAPDAWEIDAEYNRRCKELGIDLVVSFQSPKCQYEYLDKDIRYERFILGIDLPTYKNVTPWKKRHNMILSSGVFDTRWWFYRFRTLCAEHPFVIHRPKQQPYLGTDYWQLLNQYRAAIACMSYTSVLKYFEIPMCGCLMFAEVTDFNQIREMGFIDGVNCIYIDEDNYKDRFKEYINTVDDPKWKRIADTGHKLVKNTYNNESEVKRFVELIESMVAAKHG